MGFDSTCLLDRRVWNLFRTVMFLYGAANV
jgi:hypothetical protein